ncbi:Rab11 [Hexamita inflata]|uniref:Rab11 n=1 Tax=Hexamita inflata TaxID=28002 RepID=A0AA86RGM1_9EUKA|nr:Rab11 [Hexamita inflata]
MTEYYDNLFKIIVIGSSGVGKSNIISRFSNGTFMKECAPTLGVEFSTKTINVTDPEQKVIRLQMWDTAGQERFHSVANQYYRGAQGAVLVYDISNKKTFEDLQKWIVELKEKAADTINVMLCGNKADLEPQRQVSFEEGQNFAQLNNMMYLETSALNGMNVEEAFKQLASCILSKQQAPVQDKKEELLLQQSEVTVKPKGCC